MKYTKILLCMTALICLAFQAGAQPVLDSRTTTMGSGIDNHSPSTDQMSRGANHNEGLSGMLQWVDQPVPSFPWYTAEGSSFYSQSYSEITFSPYRE